MPLQIPTTPSGPTHSNPRMLLIYGAPKVGKTTLFDESPDSSYKLTRLVSPLLVDMEDGSNYITARKVSVTGWQSFTELHKALKPSKEKYLVIDTIDKLEEYCEDKATANYKNSIMGKTFMGESVLELANGAGYKHLREAFHIALDMCLEMAEHIILIGHIRDKNLITGAGAINVIAKDLDLTGKIRNIACARADAIGYVYRSTGDKSLCCNFVTNDDVNCGSRCKHLRGIDLKPFDWSKVFITN